MLGRGVHDVAVAVIAHDRRVDVREGDDNGKEHKYDDVGLLAEEHPENAVPIGVARSGYLLHRGLVLRYALKKLLVCKAGVIQPYEFILCYSSHLGCIGDTRIHNRHEYVAGYGGYDEQHAVEQRDADYDRVVVCAYGLHQQSADAGDQVDLLHDYRAGQRAGYRAGDAVHHGYGGVFEDVLCEYLPLAESLAARELYVVGVHLVDHVAAHPLHLAGYGAYGRGCDRHDVHQPGRVVQREGGRQSELVAYGLEHQHVGQAGDGHYDDHVCVAEPVHPRVLLLGHEYAERQADYIGQRGGDDTHDEGVGYARAAVLDQGHVGVVVCVEVCVDEVQIPRAGQVGGRVQVVRALLHHAGGVIGGGADVVALGLHHGLKGVHALVDAVGSAQVYRQEVLVYIRKTIVEVEQVLVVGAVAQYGRGELLSAVGRVIEREGETPLADVLLDVVDVVKVKDSGKEVEHAYQKRGVLVRKEAGRAAGGYAVGRGHDGVQTDDRVPLSLILLCKALDIRGGLVAVLVRRAADGGDGLALILGYLAGGDQLIEPVGVGYVVEIVVLLPLLVHINGSLVVAELDVLLVLSEDKGVVQPGEDHEHH